MKKFTLKELRKKFNKKQADLSDVIAKTTAMYSMVENGKRRLSLEDALKIADFYGIRVEEIKFFDNNFNELLK
ncbi:helix-turn-helix transcriptional regulator [Tepidibacter mesophilus]|uniref:helix-turn-helix transcriptional regulator n=1 Tax=Tepidibacter mesophilus TaxID=655607 RepID=UPI000C06BC82|nr:helix-turn-helix transcriptional regulator [Tepidibacter mesophilus]